MTLWGSIESEIELKGKALFMAGRLAEAKELLAEARQLGGSEEAFVGPLARTLIFGPLASSIYFNWI